MQTSTLMIWPDCSLWNTLLALSHLSPQATTHIWQVTPSEAIQQFRSAIEGAVYDAGDRPKEIQVAMRAHLKRMFDHLANIAKHADLGAG